MEETLRVGFSSYIVQIAIIVFAIGVPAILIGSAIGGRRGRQ